MVRSAAPGYLLAALTSRCNLRCRGCLQGADGSGSDMDAAVIEKMLALVDCGQPLVVQMTGGEPTLVPEKIEQLAAAAGRMRRVPRLALQTNGTMITAELLAICCRYRIEIGVSLDGPPQLQQRLRGGSRATVQGLALLEERKIPFRVTTVVSGENIDQLRRLLLFVAGFAGCRGVGLDLLVRRGRGENLTLPTAEQLQQAGAELAALLPLLNARRRHPIILRELALLQSKRRGSGAFCHAASGRSLAVTPDGALYPCGQTLGDQRFFLGTVDRPQLSQKNHLAARELQLFSAACPACTLHRRCPGECPSRMLYNGTEGTNICGLYRGLAGG